MAEIKGAALIAQCLKHHGIRELFGAIGYLRRHVGVALTITGPGMTNAVTALGNAWANGWPLMGISGGTDTRTIYRGALQEGPQLEGARPFCKWIARAQRVEDLPRLIAQGLRAAWHGRPGPVYLEVPADVISGMGNDE